MADYILMTDSDTEIPYQFAKENNIEVFLMPYTLDGKEEIFDLGLTTDYKYFYKRLREGAAATTSTRSPQDILEFYEAILARGNDILYICFSSKLSAHYELSIMARQQALKKYPDRRIEIVDSAGIAMGAGMLVYHAAKLKSSMSLDELKDWVEQNKDHALHFFTVDSLDYLKKTGRLSATKATLGSILDLKPVLMLSREGKVVAFDKVKGKRRVAKYLANCVQENVLDTPLSRDLLVVCHGDNEEQARMVQEEIEKITKFEHIWFMDVGPVIGCHAGPGVIGVLMMGKEKTQ